jgi:hypothetical protein
MSKKTIDWDAVEIEYSSGIKTLRQIGEEFGCSEGAVRKKAKERGWSRDLSAKIKLKADEEVRKREYAEEYANSPDKRIKEKEQVEIGAKLQSDIIMKHRSSLGKAREFADKLFSELEVDGELTTAQKTSILEKLTRTLSTLTTSERLAFGIDTTFDPSKAAEEAAKQIDKTDLARRVAFMLTKAVKEQ